MRTEAQLTHHSVTTFATKNIHRAMVSVGTERFFSTNSGTLFASANKACNEEKIHCNADAQKDSPCSFWKGMNFQNV